MQENETIDDMVTKFTKINGLSSLGDGIDNDQKVRKIIRAPLHLGKSKPQL